MRLGYPPTSLGREQPQQVLSLRSDKMPPSWSSPISYLCIISNHFHAPISVDLSGFGYVIAAKLQLESFSRPTWRV